MKASELMNALFHAIEKVGDVPVETLGTTGLCIIDGVSAITDTVNNKSKIVLEKSVNI
jgi:hypothetical protein